MGTTKVNSPVYFVPPCIYTASENIAVV